MTKLATSSGIVIYEAGSKLHICKQPAGGVATFLFVTGLLAFILLANGVLQLTLLKDQVSDSSKLGMLLIGIGLVFAFIFWQIKKHQKNANAAPPATLPTICTFDFENNNLLGPQQNILAPLGQTYITRKMQLTSSSPELLLNWNGGSLSICKGNPFSGGIGDIEKVLLAKGIRKK